MIRAKKEAGKPVGGMYDRKKSEPSMSLKRMSIQACAAVCLLFLLSGCGLVYDAAVGVGSINWPEFDRGKLYDPDFYRTATEDDMRKLIAGRSLARESTTYTSKSFARHRGHFGINDLLSPVIPNSYVSEASWTVRPVDVAREHSPRKEVVRVVEEATGISAGEGLAYRLLMAKDTSVASLLEENRDVPFNCAVCSVVVQKSTVSDLRLYLEQHPEADVNCTPQPVYEQPGRYRGPNTPLVAAMDNAAGRNGLEMLNLLLQKGVAVSSWRYTERYSGSPRPFPTGEFAAALLKSGGDIPQATCNELVQLLNFTSAGQCAVFSDYIYGRCSFSPKAEKEILERSIRFKRTVLLKKSIGRGVTPEKGKAYGIYDWIEGDTEELETLLTRYGATIEGR